MNEVKAFESPKLGTIRTVTIKGKVLFCGKDVATALGYLNPNKAILNHCKENGITFFDIPTLGDNQKFIDEVNLCRLVYHSQLPNAEKFDSWTFVEVSPTSYNTVLSTTEPNTTPIKTNIDNAQQSQFVFLKDGEPYTNSEIISQNCEVTHHAVQVLIDKYKKDFEEFKLVSFEMRAVKHSSGTKYEKIYDLNEQQATLLITYMKNTQVVRAFKKALVKQFFEMRQYIMQQKINVKSSTELLQTVTVKDNLEMLKLVMDDLHLNEDSKINTYNKFFKAYNLPTNLLTDCANNTNTNNNNKVELLSCTDCLKRINAKLDTRAFNRILLSEGYLEERQRTRLQSKTGVKKFKALTEKGLEFGENQDNLREVHPLYYVDKFQDLYNKLTTGK